MHLYKVTYSFTLTLIKKKAFGLFFMSYLCVRKFSDSFDFQNHVPNPMKYAG